MELVRLDNGLVSTLKFCILSVLHASFTTNLIAGVVFVLTDQLKFDFGDVVCPMHQVRNSRLFNHKVTIRNRRNIVLRSSVNNTLLGASRSLVKVRALNLSAYRVFTNRLFMLVYILLLGPFVLIESKLYSFFTLRLSTARLDHFNLFLKIRESYKSSISREFKSKSWI